MAEAKRDGNSITTLLAVSNADGVTPVVLYADPTTHRLLVSATAGSLDDLTDVTITSAAQGDILYRNATVWVNLAAGTSGKFLRTNGAAANPSWETVTATITGADTRVLFFDGADTPAGDAGFTYNKTTDAVSANGGFLPMVNDTGALGSATLSFSDVFIASGGLINFANGNAVITHSSGILTVSTGDLRVTTAGTDAASVVTVGGTQTLTNKTLTSPTIGTSPTAAGATWTDLGTVTTADINGGTIDGAVIGGASAGAITGTTITANTGFLPDADGGAYLGQATQAFSGLFLDTLATVNFDNGNAVITHSSGVLTVSTGDLRVTTAGTNAASVVTVGGTQTLTSKTLTSPTIKTSPTAAGATWTDLGTVTTADINGGTIDGAVIGGASSAAGTFTTLSATTIELGHASDTTLARVSAGVVSIEGSNIIKANTTATRTIVLTAAGGWPSTTAGCATNTKVETSTNDMNYYTLDFDQTTEENAEWSVTMPDNYDGGTITAIFYWTAASGTGDVIWGIKGRAFANDDALDQAFGTAVTVTDTLITAGDLHISSATAAVTFAGSPAGGQFVAIKVYRDADAGGDTLNADARLMAVKIEYGINAYTD
jgi:hypothetical protein